MTVSGGEPLMQDRFVVKLLEGKRDEHPHDDRTNECAAIA